MSQFHNTESAEEVALAWHRLGKHISVIACVAHIGCGLLALGGIVWHHWAVGQHKKSIIEIKQTIGRGE